MDEKHEKTWPEIDRRVFHLHVFDPGGAERTEGLRSTGIFKDPWFSCERRGANASNAWG